MELNALGTFIAAAETGSFSKAAERLHLSQPAVSKRIAALEASLQLSLFDRIGRQLHLTEAGHALLPRAQRILLEVVDSQRALSRLSQHISGQLRLGISHHIGLHHMPDVLRRYTQLHPQVKLDIRFVDSEEACHAINHGQLELAIVTLPPQPATSLICQTLWPDPMSVVVAHNHPLAQQSHLALDALAAHPAILPTSNTFTRQIVEQVFAPLQLDLDITLSTNYLETIKTMVAVGLGWSVLPLTLQDQELVALSLPELSFSRQLGSVRHRHRTLSQAAQALLDLLDRQPDTLTANN